LFCSDLPFLNSFVFSFFDQPFAGGSPAATHFLCLAKESKQRKATAGSRSFGLPGAAKQKMGRETNSLRSDKFPFFFHFSHRIIGWLQAEIPDWLASHRLGALAFGFVILTFGRDQLRRCCSGCEERRPSFHRPTLARRSEPVWNSRLRVAGGGEYKSDKEGKLV